MKYSPMAWTAPLLLLSSTAVGGETCPGSSPCITTVVEPGNGDQVDMVVSVFVTFEDFKTAFITACAGIPGMEATIAARNGVFYQHGFGGDTAPDQTVIDAGNPSLALDTFVTIGAKSFGTESVPEDATGLSPGWPGFGPDSLMLEDVAWFVTPDDAQAHAGMADNPPDGVLIGQFSVAFGAAFDVAVYGELIFSGEVDGVGFQVFRSFEALFCSLTDTDGNGLVNTVDLLDVISQWGPCGAECTADFRGDGMVSTRDLLDVIENWGRCG